jgi:hypothetical protein
MSKKSITVLIYHCHRLSELQNQIIPFHLLVTAKLTKTLNKTTINTNCHFN